MKFRWKLLLLLLTVSILPIVVLRTFGIHHVRNMAEALSEKIDQGRREAAQNEIQSQLDGSREALNIERERLSMALSFLSDLLTRGYAQPADEGHRPTRPYDAVSPQAAAAGSSSRLCLLVPESATPGTLRQATLLSQAETTFVAIADHLGNSVLRQDIAFTKGAAASYPCLHPGLNYGDVSQAAWYRNAFRESLFSWSRPFEDSSTGRYVVSVSILREDDNDQPMGAVSLTVALDRLLENILAFLKLPGGTKIFLCMLDQDPASGAVGLRVLLESNAAAGTEPQWLQIPDNVTATQMIKDVAERTSWIVRMPFNGQDAFWAHTPLPSQGASVIFVIPADDLLRPAQTLQSAIRERVGNVETLTAAFLIALAVINGVLVFIFSKTVTRPLEALSAASMQLAAGDFDARVDIASPDEFGSMAAVFNRVGPQLKQHYRDREALQAAVEIQQSLLPQTPPRLAGLDVFAMSLYSEKVGGDYFDYICVRENEQQRLCIAVGDVSGHGVSSAISMATARAFLRMRASLSGRLAEIIADVNRKFVEDVEYSGQFMTLFLARADRGAKTVQWVRAGHDPALLYDPNRDVFHEMAGEGAPLGVSDQARFEESSTTIEPGQVIVIGTDGVWETRNQRDEMFGKERLKGLIRQNAEATAQNIVLAVLDAVEEFRGPDQPEDDMTLMALKVMA